MGGIYDITLSNKLGMYFSKEHQTINDEGDHGWDNDL